MSVVLNTFRASDVCSVMSVGYSPYSLLRILYTCATLSACIPLPLPPSPFFFLLPSPTPSLPPPLPSFLSLHTHRSLDVNSPLYLGGLESHLSELHLSSTSYQGCISNVSLNGALMDLGSPLRSRGTESGCPPLDVTCSSRQVMCTGEECEEMWNGTVCSCGDNCQRGE